MKRTKKEIVRMLINKEFDTDDEEILVDMLIEEPIAIDVDKQVEKNAKFGDKIADKITSVAGSWGFIITFIMIIILWICLNLFLLSDSYDPYPFILLNLILSCVAALQAPVIMMSQNRESKKDRLRGQNDYKVDLKSELMLEDLHEKMEHLLSNQKEIMKKIKLIEEQK